MHWATPKRTRKNSYNFNPEKIGVFCLTVDGQEKCYERSEAVVLMHINYSALKPHVDALI